MTDENKQALNNMPELKPCPFCGGSVSLEQPIHAKEKCSKDWWGVVCRNTKNIGGTCAIEQHASRTKEAAIKRWNTRHVPSEVVEALRNAQLIFLAEGIDDGGIVDHALSLLTAQEGK